MKLDLYFISAAIVAILLFVGILIYFFQHKFFFHPEKLSPDFKFAYDHLKAEEKTVEPEHGAQINYLHFVLLKKYYLLLLISVGINGFESISACGIFKKNLLSSAIKLAVVVIR